MTIRFTNRHNIPNAIARAIIEDAKPTAGRYSVTQLLSPPRIRWLLERHDVEVDVTERLWAILGKSMHSLLERYVAEPERQLVAEIDGVLVSGTIDSAERGRVLGDANVLRDWKMTSVYVGADGRDEWEQQLNIYAWLCRHARWVVGSAKLHEIDAASRFLPDALQATMIYRDWSAARAGASANGYPKSQVQTIDVPMWEDKAAEDLLRSRLDAHRSAECDQLPERCSDAERWKRQDTYAIRKPGRKTAVRVFDDYASACDFIAAEDIKVRNALTIEKRPGVDVRCAGYCPARSVCPHGRDVAAAAVAASGVAEDPPV
jgi:hypothetical protein